MYYKNNDSIGIKKKGAGQVFSFGAGKKLGEKRLRAWADDVLKKLDDGTDEKDVKAWIHERLVG
jgi:hypothetical protein